MKGCRTLARAMHTQCNSMHVCVCSLYLCCMCMAACGHLVCVHMCGILKLMLSSWIALPLLVLGLSLEFAISTTSVRQLVPLQPVWVVPKSPYLCFPSTKTSGVPPQPPAFTRKGAADLNSGL